MYKMSHCSDTTTCPDGNCTGCKDGKVWCLDPRCSPYCPEAECIITNQHDAAVNIIICIVILGIISILIIYWLVYGPEFFE